MEDIKYKVQLKQIQHGERLEEIVDIPIVVKKTHLIGNGQDLSFTLFHGMDTESFSITVYEISPAGKLLVTPSTALIRGELLDLHFTKVIDEKSYEVVLIG